MIQNIKWLLLVAITVIACNKNDDDAVIVEEPLTKGTADFTKYVALGDSFAAGYSDGALFTAGQKNSYPSILAEQFALVGGGEFKVPYMNDNVGGFTTTALGQFPRLVFNGAAPVSVGLPPYNQVPTTNLLPALTGGFNNFGVPGAKSYHLLAPGYGSAAGLGTIPATANPYFVHFASSSTTSILADAMAQNPTFFSLYIGGNDVLGYALSGGVTKSQDPIKGDDITPPASFDGYYNLLAKTLSTGGKKGVVANLPYISTLPNFTTVPFNALNAKTLGGGNEAAGTATITALNTQLYGPLHAALSAFSAGDRINVLAPTASAPNLPLLIKDESLPNLSAQLTAAFTPTLGAATATAFGLVFGQARQAKADDLMLLSTKNVIGTAPTAAEVGFTPPASINKYGITFPLQDKHVLIPSEILEIKNATDYYNKVIEKAATDYNLAFVDAASILNKLNSTGITFGNYQMTSAYVTGGAFSLDGVHPSPRGYALIANEFLKAINAKYGSNFRGVDLAKYQIQYPAIIN